MAPVDCASDDGEETDAMMRERLANSLSQSFPSSSLSHILHVNQSDNVDGDRLSLSCFAELCQMKNETVDNTEDDDELTCLDWLQDINLLQSISPSAQQCPNSGMFLPSYSDATSSGLSPDGQKENASVPAYDPMRNLTSKPPYSFSVLIFMAIEASPRRRLPVKDIYNWIAEHFPYYRRAPVGWRNSVRHNLSLNKCFRKVEKSMGKGSSWCIDPLFRPNLLQAMKRTPYYPFQQVQMTSSPSPSNSDDSWLSRCYYNDVKSECESAAADRAKRLSPDLFPLLSRRMMHANETNADDIDVANTLASLGDMRNASYLSDHERKLQKLRAVDNLANVIRTPPPSKDHSYGYKLSLLREAQSSLSPSSGSVGSRTDDGCELDKCDLELATDISGIGGDIEVTSVDIRSTKTKSRSKVEVHLKSVKSQQLLCGMDDDEAEEERKRLEGVNALLNLAANSIRSKRDVSRFTPASGLLWARALCSRKKNKLVKKSKKTVKKLKKNGKKKIVKKV